MVVFVCISSVKVSGCSVGFLVEVFYLSLRVVLGFGYSFLVCFKCIFLSFILGSLD